MLVGRLVVTIRPCAEFSGPAGEAGWARNGADPDGQAVAEAIVAVLRADGLAVSAPERQFEHGWDFEVSLNRRRVWIQIADLGGAYVLTSRMRAAFIPRPQDDATYADVLKRLDAGLRGHAWFSDIRWLYREDVLTGRPGAAAPVAD